MNQQNVFFKLCACIYLLIHNIKWMNLTIHYYDLPHAFAFFFFFVVFFCLTKFKKNALMNKRHCAIE